MFLFNLILVAVTVAVEQDTDCPSNTDTTFCDMIETETDNYYIGCDDPDAELLPHPEYCTLYILCYNGVEKHGRSSITRCCSEIDTDGDGYFDQRLWFNTENNYCDFPGNVHRSCSLPVANISTTPTTVGISTTTTNIAISTTTTTNIARSTTTTTNIARSTTTTTTTLGLITTTTTTTTTTTNAKTTGAISTIPAPCSSVGWCHAVDARNESWEESFGETARKNCSAGYARWFCDGCTGEFEGEQPDRSECVDDWIQEVGDEVGVYLILFNVII